MNDDLFSDDRGRSRLDRAIDRAVHEMVRVNPAPGFRRRVLARLEPRAARWPLVPAGYAAAAAVLVLLLSVGIMFVREDRARPVAHETAAAADPQPGTVATAPVEPAGPTASAAPRPATPRARSARVTREPIPMPNVANVFGARRPGAVAASAPAADTVWPNSNAPAGRLPDEPAALPAFDTPAPAPIDIPAIVIPPLVIPAAPKGQ